MSLVAFYLGIVIMCNLLSELDIFTVFGTFKVYVLFVAGSLNFWFVNQINSFYNLSILILSQGSVTLKVTQNFDCEPKTVML